MAGPGQAERSPAQQGVVGASHGNVPLPGEANRAGAVRAMFDRIAPSYDLLNRVMTLRVDQHWRRRLVGAVALRPGQRLLDVCAGTMDVAAEARRQIPAATVIGADFSLPMLARGAAKTGLPAAQADALSLPFSDASFDAVTVAFGVRNLESLERGVAELARVLRPGGRLGVAEFFRSESSGSRLVHAAYNRLALPVLGRILSPDPAAYRYLVESMERFASRAEFEQLCRKHGFGSVAGEALFPGVSGASGAPYARRLLDFLAAHGAAHGVSVDLVFTETGKQVWKHEIGAEPAYPFRIWKSRDFTAPFASGSAGYDAMAVVPCSAGALARIAYGISVDLLGRAADVMLKERKQLVLCLRETPISLVHARAMVQVIEAGAFVMPASPSFYSMPKDINELVDTVVARLLDRLGIPNELMRRWEGLAARSSPRATAGGREPQED